MEGETFKASIIGVLEDGTAVVNDFGFFDASSGSGHVDTGTAAGDFQTLVQAAFVAVMPNNWKPVRYRFACTGGSSVGEVGFVEPVSPPTGALGVTNIMPNEIAICIKRNTGYASRGDRGRIFLGPVAQDLVSDSNHPDYANSDLQALALKLKANLVTSGRTLRPVLLRPDGTCNGRQIQWVAINKVFCHRRTRRPRVGA